MKNELAGRRGLKGELEDNDIISTLAPRISLKVDKTVVDNQRILPAKAQG